MPWPVTGKPFIPFRATWCLLMAMKFELSADFVGSPELGKFCKGVWKVSHSNLNYIMWATADYNNIIIFKRFLFGMQSVTTSWLHSLQI